MTRRLAAGFAAQIEEDEDPEENEYDLEDS